MWQGLARQEVGDQPVVQEVTIYGDFLDTSETTTWRTWQATGTGPAFLAFWAYCQDGTQETETFVDLPPVNDHMPAGV